MKLKTNLKVSAPSSITNPACGFEVLGLAINVPRDEIIITEANQPGIHITQIIHNKSKISLDTDKNIAGIAAQSLLDHLIKEHGADKEIGLNFKLIKNIPIGLGIGSSSASAVAGVMAINEVFGCPLEKRELAFFAARGEMQAENVSKIHSIIPSLIGGLVLTRDHQTLDFHRLPVPKGLHIVVVHPKRKALISHNIHNHIPRKVQTNHAINQAANMGAFVHSLYMSDFDLMARSLEDNLIEKYWAEYIPFFKEIQTAAYNKHALGCSIAGKGSAVFALCKNSFDAVNVAEAMQAVLAENKIKSTSIISTINQEGAIRD